MELSIVKEYELILVLTSISIPILRKFLNVYSFKITKALSQSLLQYTNWNIILIFINHFCNNKMLNVFLTINSATIFIIYHIFHFTYKHLIMTMPNVPKWFTNTHINIASFFVHILPILVYSHDFYKNKYEIGYNMGYNVLLFNLIWAFQNFLSFDPEKAYFKISQEKVYYVWCLLMVSNISIGHLLETQRYMIYLK